ncbi:MAG: hypothetical protein AAFR88_03130 [Pseudomonadota bacterium]
MSGPLVLALAADRACAEVITDEMVEADLDPLLCLMEAGSAPPTVSASRVVVLIVSKATMSDEPLALAFRAIAQEACAEDRAVAVIVEDGAELDLGCTQYKFCHSTRPKGVLKPFMRRTLALADIVTAAKYKASGRDPPPPSAPRRLALRYAAAFSSAVILPLVAVLSFTDVLIGLAGALGLDEAPSSDARAAYAKITPGNCQELREFIGAHEASRLTREAQQRLDLVEQRERMTRETREVPLRILALPEADEAYRPRTGAEGKALAKAQSEAEARCGEVALAAGGELLAFKLEDASPTCDEFAAGYACRLSATALCEASIERAETYDWCP